MGIWKSIVSGAVSVIFTVAPAIAQTMRAVATVQGEPMYQVLPANAIPAIMDPQFLTGAEADAQMAADELVMGVVIDGEARAYSLWQLDAHEIVNDEIRGVEFAVTW